MPNQIDDELDEVAFNLILVGLPKDCAMVEGKILAPERKKQFTEDRNKLFEEAKQSLTALVAKRERLARLDEVKRRYVNLILQDVDEFKWKQYAEDRIAALTNVDTYPNGRTDPCNICGDGGHTELACPNTNVDKEKTE